MTGSTTIAIEGREIQLTNLDRILWPEQGYTKHDLVEYYGAVFSFISPHLRQRPLVFTRYPNGIKEASFYQKNAPQYLPEWIRTFAWAGSKGIKHYVLVEAQADLIWLANQACIEIHPWMSQTFTIENPDYIVFDLDPSEQNTFEEIVSVARLLKDLMGKLGLDVYLKTSGSKGLHIYLPIVPRYSYSQVRSFAQMIAQLICNVVPDIATIQRSLQHRGKRIYVDYLQNGLGKTICAPYSVRPRDGATVSTPIGWQELESIRPGDFTIRTVLERLKKVGDLFQEVLNDRQELEKAIKILGISQRSEL
ncbi:MAG: DNA polymerase domain-containing protein [Firmicutes bacterium HGW-Firmicutes-15]|nr:MAG: DNA polymerase domain-containing protein [Firmicutes bacterium HGW-Firmicutes-15]